MSIPTVRITVDLGEFSEKEIKDYASNELGMFENLEEVETADLIEELNSRGVEGLDIYNENIVVSSVMEVILGNLERIPLDEFESIIRKYNL